MLFNPIQLGSLYFKRPDLTDYLRLILTEVTIYLKMLHINLVAH